MELRERIAEATRATQRERQGLRLSTLRLIGAAIKDRDIARRGEGLEGLAGDDEVLAILGRMVKQRHESARAYEEGGRPDLTEAELAEIRVIEEFLPRQMTPDEVASAVATVMAELGASSIRDMGRVMAALKERHAGRMDFAAASALVKARLAQG